MTITMGISVFAPSISFFFLLVSLTDVSYGYVIDQQPIGRILFRLFCENKRPLYYRYISFLDNVTRLVLIFVGSSDIEMLHAFSVAMYIRIIAVDIGFKLSTKKANQISIEFFSSSLFIKRKIRARIWWKSAWHWMGYWEAISWHWVRT